MYWNMVTRTTGSPFFVCQMTALLPMLRKSRYPRYAKVWYEGSGEKKYIKGSETSLNLRPLPPLNIVRQSNYTFQRYLTTFYISIHTKTTAISPVFHSILHKNTTRANPRN